MTLRAGTIRTPVAELTVVASDAGLRAVLWPGESPGRVPVGDDVVDDSGHPVVAAALTQLEEYVAGRRTVFDLPLDVRGTPFQQRAWLALADIPYGQTVTYGEQARRLGQPRAVRAVGAANGRNPVSIVLPCHRVVGADGSLTGYGGGLGTKRWLLQHEGVLADEAEQLTLV